VQLVREHSSFAGCLPVDMAILKGGKIRALIEVDGPHHYRSSDNALTRAGQCKEALYKAKHPIAIFHRVRWDEEKEAGAEVLAKQFCAQYLPYIMEDMTPWKEALGVASGKLRGIVSWCLRSEQGGNNDDSHED
jgi:hypothetical protein